MLRARPATSAADAARKRDHSRESNHPLLNLRTTPETSTQNANNSAGHLASSPTKNCCVLYRTHQLNGSTTKTNPAAARRQTIPRVLSDLWEPALLCFCTNQQRQQAFEVADAASKLHQNRGDIVKLLAIAAKRIHGLQKRVQRERRRLIHVAENGLNPIVAKHLSIAAERFGDAVCKEHEPIAAADLTLVERPVCILGNAKQQPRRSEISPLSGV